MSRATRFTGFRPAGEPLEGELAALADGSLPEARRAAVEAMVERSRVVAACLAEQRLAVALVRSAAVVKAPAGLRQIVSSQAQRRTGARPAGGRDRGGS